MHNFTTKENEVLSLVRDLALTPADETSLQLLSWLSRLSVSDCALACASDGADEGMPESCEVAERGPVFETPESVYRLTPSQFSYRMHCRPKTAMERGELQSVHSLSIFTDLDFE